MMAIYGPLFGGIEKSALVVAGFLFLTCHAAGQANPDFLDLVKTEKFRLELHRLQDRCAIQFNDAPKSEMLDIPYPCGFVRTSKRLKAQTYHYKEVGQVFVVAGPPSAEEAYTEDSGVEPEHMCSNQGQAIIVQGVN